jgi:peptidoglycan/LPS O-acetylase OafA/YrhL
MPGAASSLSTAGRSLLTLGAIVHRSDTIAPSTRRTQARLHGLDGLRGVAALVVVIYHATLASTLGDDFFETIRGRLEPDGTVAVLTDTPLRIVTLGPEAVVVFFVLSGFVLTLPLLSGRAMDLWSYYPRRVARLWVPAAASVILSVLLILATRPDPERAVSEWGARYSFAPSDVSVQRIVESLFFITNSPSLNNPMWSLRWELLFSLFLPLVFLLVLRVRRWHLVWILGCAALVGVGAFAGVDSLRYGPVFIAGALAAKLLHDRRASLPPWSSWLLTGFGLAAVVAPDAVRVLTGGRTSPAAEILVVLGATAAVIGLATPSAISRAFATPPIAFLGRISFSLYLVHVPVLLAALHLAPTHPNRALAVGVVASIGVGWLFARFIEEPSARLARRWGDRASAAARTVSERGRGV